MKRLIVIGAGGLGQEMVWAARNVNRAQPEFELLGYCDDNAAKHGQTYYGLKVLGTPEEVAPGVGSPVGFICGIGNNSKRSSMVERALKLGWTPQTLIDPSVQVAEGVQVGAGSYVGVGSILSPNVKLGGHVVINHQCSIGHHSVVEDFAQVSPGGRISGYAHLQTGAYVGSNAIVIQGATIGSFTVLGAGSFAAGDLPDRVTAVGNPARVIIQRSSI